MNRTLLPLRALIVVFGLVSLLFPAGLVAQAGLVGRLNIVLGEITRVRQAQLLTADLERAQLNEESGIRGFAASGQTVFLEPFERGFAEFPTALHGVRDRMLEPSAVHDADDAAVVELLESIQQKNDRWIAQVARPVLHGDRTSGTYLGGKRLVDAFRADIASIRGHLDALYERWSARREEVVHVGVLVGASAGGLIIIELVIFGGILLRMGRELDREHSAVETLQTAIVSTLGANPALDVGSIYFSATRGARVGGDVFDVYAIDPQTAMIVVGDVSGKGIAAAVDTAFVRFSLRAYASETRDPGEIVTRFNALYAVERPPEAFVVLFVGIFDASSGTLSYTNAGHEAAYVRRHGTLERLPPTNPIVGIDPLERFGTAATQLAAGETLVLATDGLTEARDPQHTFLDIREIERWIATAPDATPQQLVDDLATRVRRWTRNRIADDLAILAVRPRGGVPTRG